MLTLYHRPTCPPCNFVLGEAEALGLKFNLKDISNDPALVEELIARGGKRQVPYLVDQEKGVEMYESADISVYLQENYGGNRPSLYEGVRIHSSDETCESCQ